MATPLWSERFHRQMTDIFVVQDEIARGIVERLRPQRAAPRVRRVGKRRPSLAAWQSYWEGCHHQFHFTPEGLAQGKACIERAIEQDPQYALAYVGLANHYAITANLALAPPREVLPLARRAIEKALEQDDTLAEAHATAAVVSVFWEHDWTGAARAFHRALEQSPGSSSVHHLYAFWWLQPQGRLEEAVEENARALELDPLSPFLRVIQAYTLHLTHRQEEAVGLCHAALRLDENYYLAHLMLGQTYLQQGKLEDAQAACDRAVALAGDAPVERGLLAVIHALAGRHEQARQVLSDLNDMARRRYVPASAIGRVHLALGEEAEGCEWLEKAIDERDPGALTLAVEPFFNRFRENAAYHHLMRKLGLEAPGM